MGIIHRDIKPENILIVPGTSSARVRITDFTNAWLAPGESPEEWKRNYDVEPGARESDGIGTDSAATVDDDARAAFERRRDDAGRRLETAHARLEDRSDAGTIEATEN